MRPSKSSNSEGVPTRFSTDVPQIPANLEERPPLPILDPTAQSLVEQPNLTQLTQSRYSPWLAALIYLLARYAVLPFYFRRIDVSGQENFPHTGAVIVAATHRSRWDGFMVPYAIGLDVSGRVLRFMVTADEMKGIQGWLIRRLGGFAVNTRQPTIAALRYSIELLQQHEALVIFPEGNIYRHCTALKPGFARLALQAEASQPNLGVQIVPISIQYSQPLVPWRSAVKVRVEKPLSVADYVLETPKVSAKRLTADLERVFRSHAEQACSSEH